MKGALFVIFALGVTLVIVWRLFQSRLRKVMQMYDRGNVCISGLRGTGKDMLTANVVVRREKPYISNVDYGGKYIPFVPLQFDCGRNTYDNFISGRIRKYVYPYDDGTDVYVSDLGIYYPSHYCNELNKKYPYIPTFMALSRQLGECNLHLNVQNLNRAWDKLREQADQYIGCRWCKVYFGKLVVQKIRVYERYQSCVDRVPPFRLPKPLISPTRLDAWHAEKERYAQSFGQVDEMLLVYINKSKYDTRIFKKMLEEGYDDENEEIVAIDFRRKSDRT